MANVTYLIGAGASYPYVPLIKGMPDELNDFHLFLKSNRSYVDLDVFRHETGTNVDIVEIEEEILSFCREMDLELRRHSTVDTYAKKLRIQAGNGDDISLTKYYKLKALLSGCFTRIQLLNQVENRYDTFLASILDTASYEFPHNLNILSWNYDFQFEKAFAEYSTKKDLKSLQIEMNVIPRDANNRTLSNNKFGILKINGTAGYYNKRNRQYVTLANDLSKFDKVTFLKDFYLNYFFQVHKRDEGDSLLWFAWEKGWHDFDVDSVIEEATKDTNVFVVIGYSFPFFNRVMDRAIFNNSPIQKIYVQDIDTKTVIDNMRSLLLGDNIRIIPIEINGDKNNQFFIPPEL